MKLSLRMLVLALFVALAVAVRADAQGPTQEPVLISPVSGKAMPLRSVANGATAQVDTVSIVDCTSIANCTVNAPSSATTSSIFAVYDNGASAAAWPITIAANGRTIDGGSSFKLTRSGGVAMFLLDASGDWRRIYAPRRSTTSSIAVYAAGDVPDFASVAPGTKGNVLVSDGTSWTSGTSGGWATALDCDLTAQATVNPLSDNTNQTWCGVTFNVQLPASSRGSIAMVNGTGLQFSTVTGATGYGTTCGGGGDRSAGLVWIPLSSLGIANLDWTTELRVWIALGSQTDCANASHGTFWGFDSNPGAHPHDFNTITNGFAIYASAQCQAINVAGLVSGIYSGAWNSAGVTTQAITGNTNYASLGQFRLDTGPIYGNVSLGSHPVAFFGGAFSSAWSTTLVPWVRSQTDQGLAEGSPGIGFANSRTSPATPAARFGVVVGHWNSNAATTPSSATVTRVRVDYRY